METAVEQVTVPEASDALAQGLKKLFTAVLANHKAMAGATMAEVSADVTEAVKDLGPLFSKFGMIGEELKTDPVGVAEAFVLAGFDVAKSLKA